MVLFEPGPVLLMLALLPAGVPFPPWPPAPLLPGVGLLLTAALRPVPAVLKALPLMPPPALVLKPLSTLPLLAPWLVVFSPRIPLWFVVLACVVEAPRI